MKELCSHKSDPRRCPLALVAYPFHLTHLAVLRNFGGRHQYLWTKFTERGAFGRHPGVPEIPELIPQPRFY
jgi:hypothetical protein